jgi:hypothetical protein
MFRIASGLGFLIPDAALEIEAAMSTGAMRRDR